MVQEIWNMVTDLKTERTKQMAQGQACKPTISYAEALKATSLAQRAHLPSLFPQAPLELKNIKVRITDRTEHLSALAVPNATIRDRINRLTATTLALGVKRLGSGDILIQTKDQTAKRTLEKTPGWLTGVAPSATILPDRFFVFAHSIRVVNINLLDGKAAERASQENQVLHLGLQIMRLSWPQTPSETRLYTSLIIKTDSLEAANRLIDHGFIEGSEVKQCELYDTKCRITQCF